MSALLALLLLHPAHGEGERRVREGLHSLALDDRHRRRQPHWRSDAESRRGVFPALPPGQKYELVLEGAEHSAFTDRALPGAALPRSPNHHRALLAISTAFFDSTLKGDAAAREWLEGDGARSVLEEKDLWQWK